MNGVAIGSYIEPSFRIQPKLDVPAMTNSMNGITLPGFAAGSRIVLPLTSIGSVAYYNAAGTLVWSRAYNVNHAAVDGWVGFYYDATDAFLYALGIDTGVSPNEFFLYHIDVAGTVFFDFNAQPAGDFTSTVLFANNVGFNRAADGAGNFFLYEGTSGEYMELSTAAIVTDPVAIHDDLYLATPVYKTANGNYCSKFFQNSTTKAQSVMLASDNGRETEYIYLPPLAGVACTSAGAYPQMWGGYVAMIRIANENVLNGARFFEKAVFDAGIDELCRRCGVA